MTENKFTESLKGRKIVIDILPAKGHFYGILKLANLIKSQGANVFFVAMSGLEKELKENEFESLELPNIYSPFILARYRIQYKTLIESFYNFLNRKKIIDRFNEGHSYLIKKIKKEKIDLILLDEQNALKSILYQMANVPVITVETKPEPFKFKHSPPFTSGFIPRNTLLSNIYVKYLWKKKLWSNRCRLLKIRFSLFGMDDYSLLKKFAKKNGFDFSSQIDLNRGFGIGYRGSVQRLNLISNKLEFQLPNIEHTCYVGPMIDVYRKIDISKEKRFSTLLSKIKQYKDEGKGLAIFCSLGTNTPMVQRLVTSFYKKLVKVATMHPNDFFVISTGVLGMSFNIEEFIPYPKNLYFFEFLPQLELLQHCDIMITHAGCTSVAECVFNAVPMLAFPLSPDWEQPGYAARIVNHKIGLRGNIKKDSSASISKKITAIRKDYSIYNENISKLKLEFESADYSSDLINCIVRTINNKTFRLAT